MISAQKEQWAEPDPGPDVEPFTLPEGDDDIDAYRNSKGAEPLPVIPDAASQAILAAVAQARAAQSNVQATVSLVLVTLGVSLETHDIAFEDGRAVVVKR